jgi:hypothetical protein
VEALVRTPAVPVGGMVNTVVFAPVTTTKVRVVFTHRGRARSGLTELTVWKE